MSCLHCTLGLDNKDNKKRWLNEFIWQHFI